jgi:hypothetical protein
LNCNSEYTKWNTTLFNHFFNAENAGNHVILYVDRDLVNDIGKLNKLGDAQSFITAIKALNNNKSGSIVGVFEKLVCNPKDCDNCENVVPPYFGMICLTIMAWTINPTLDHNNYYKRLENLLILENNLTREGIIDTIGISNWKQKDSKKFRTLLVSSFRLLDMHTKHNLDSRFGFYSFIRTNEAQYVSIPKAQALVRARDRLFIEKFFFELDYQPGSSLNQKEIQLAINISSSKNVFFTNTLKNHWRSSSENKHLISEIVCSILRHWDGSYVENLSNSKIETSIKRVGAYLYPILSFDRFNFCNFGFRVEYKNYDFPLEQIKISWKNLVVETQRQYMGWSNELQFTNLEKYKILNSDTNITFKSSDQNDIKFNSKGIYFFSFHTQLGCFIPVYEIIEAKIYYIFLNQEKYNILMKNNIKLKVMEGKDLPSNWKVLRTESGMKLNLNGLSEIKVSSNNITMSFINGGRIGHHASSKYSVYFAPEIVVSGEMDPNYKIYGQMPRSENKFELDKITKNLYQIPQEKTMERNYIFDLVNTQQEELLDSCRLNLVGGDLPRILALANDIGPIDFEYLYNTDHFYIDIKGLELVNRNNCEYLYSLENEEIVLQSSHRLKSLDIYCNDFLCKRHYTEINIFLLKKYKLGKNILKTYWHGQFIHKQEFYIVRAPNIKTTLIGGISIGNNSQDIIVKKNTELILNAVITNYCDEAMNIYLNSEKIIPEKSNDNINIFLPPASETIKINFEWKKRIVTTKKYNLYAEPEIVMEIEEALGEKWEGSDIYKAGKPPQFRLLIGSDNDYIKKSIQGYLGDELLVREEINDNEFIYYTNNDSCIIGRTLQFSLGFNGSIYPFVGLPKVCIEEKPRCKIKIIGDKLDNRVYSKDNLPYIEINSKEQNLTVQIKDTLLKKLKNIYVIPHQFTRIDKPEKDIEILVKWYNEIIACETITISKKPFYKIELLGGEELLPESHIYYKSSPPEAVKIISNNITKYYDVYIVLDTNEINLNSNDDNTFSLSEVDFVIGKRYRICVKVGDVLITSLRFELAGRCWYKLGCQYDQFQQIDEITPWDPCWLIEKKGKNLPQVYKIRNCDFTPSQCPCFPNISSSKQVSKKLQKLWKEMVRRCSTNGLDEYQKKFWNCFTSRINK